MKAVFLKMSAFLLASLPAVASPGQDMGTDSATMTETLRNTPAVTKLPQKAPGYIDVSWDVVLPDNVILNNMYIYSVEDPWIRYSDFASQTGGGTLPAGQYFFQFTAVNNFDKNAYVYISRTIDITKEKHFTFDLNDCRHCIKAKTIMPDGTEARPDTWRSSLGGLDTDGTVELYDLELAVLRRSGGMTVCSTSISPKMMEDEGETLEWSTSFYVNKPDGEYDIVVLSLFKQKSNRDMGGTFHVLPMEALDEETILETTSDGYVRLDANYGEFAEIPLKVQDHKIKHSFIRNVMSNNGICDMVGGGITHLDSSSVLWIYVKNNPLSTVIPLCRYGEVMAQDIDGGSGSPVFYPVISLPVTFSDSKVIYNAFLSDEFYMSTNIMKPEGGVNLFLNKPFTAHPRYSWEHKDGVVPTFGNSTPLLVMTAGWQPGSKVHSAFYPAWYGRLGENRIPDLYGSYAEVEIDGEKVFTGSCSGLESWAIEEFSLPRPNGRYTFTIENDCATVDGMPSLNRTVIKCDASGNDREAPTLTWLNFRDQADEITDRFEKPSDGVLEFSAADLSSQVNEWDNLWFKCESPLSVKVEYAAEDSDDFSALPFEEVPEMFFSPCFGSFYRAPLSGVTKGSATGWFKLRVTVADEAGNSQEQTLTPVFYIAESASIDHVETEPVPMFDGETITADGPIRVYDLQGRLVGNGNDRLNTSGLSGMHIVRANGRSVKITL